MKLLILLFTILCFGSVYSQNTFYISPVFQKKMETNNNIDFNFITPQNLAVSIDVKRAYAVPGFNIGFIFGYRFKNYFFETGWVQDQSGQAFVINTTAYTNTGVDSTYYNPHVSNFTSISFNKYPIRFGLKIAGADSVKLNKKLKWNLFAFGGIDVFKRPPIGISTGSLFEFPVTPAFDKVTIESEFLNFSTKAFLPTIGLTLKGYNKKGRNVINFGLHYSQGLRRYYTSGTKIVFTNVDGYKYNHAAYSKGSGFYFTISKEINPMYKRQRKIKELQNEYKK